MSSVDSQIRSLVSQANSCQSQINAARGRYDSALGKKRQYERRLSQVRSVRNNFLRRFDGRVDTVVRKQNGMKSELQKAVRGVSSTSAHVSEIDADREKRTENDSKGSQVNSHLNQEIARCQREIDMANSEMQQAKARMDSAANQKNNCMNRARSLSKSSDATVKVR